MMLTEPLAVPCHKSVAGVAGSDVRFRDVPGRGQETLGRATHLPPASDLLCIASWVSLRYKFKMSRINLLLFCPPALSAPPPVLHPEQRQAPQPPRHSSFPRLPSTLPVEPLKSNPLLFNVTTALAQRLTSNWNIEIVFQQSAARPGSIQLLGFNNAHLTRHPSAWCPSSTQPPSPR